MYKSHKISIVIPCLNEEDGLPRVLSGRPPFVDEIVVVDNGSTDKSAEVARRYGARVIVESRRGYGYACLAGLVGATGDIRVTLDADNNLFMTDVEPVLAHMLEHDLDFVNGTRFPLSDNSLMPASVRLSNAFISWLVRRLFRIPVVDSQCGFQVFKAGIIARLALTSPGMEFSQEVKIKAWTHPAIRAGEVPIRYGKRTGVRKFKALIDSVRIVRAAIRLSRIVNVR
ncbi:MAG: glycosyltransferase family 2 protein [Lentisphaerae bacterium]|nr:glycosyltransferase family 2 protein [Lentisphaerota bacterium]